jgi:predicted enzyme related to lactoylglutathione lyase
MGLPHFILLYVDEPQASAEFYARLLDRKPLDSSPNFVMFELSPDLRLGLWARRDVEPAPSSAADAGELAMAVATNEEVEALWADRKRKGAAILQEPTTMDFGRTFLVADPDGHRLRVFCPAP